MSAVRQVLPGEDIVGESIVWDTERACLFWVDIVGKAIRRYDPATGEQQRWNTEQFVTSIGLRTDGGAIVGLTRRVALWEFGDTFETFATPEPDLPDNRLNEGRVAPDGSFWVATMPTNLNADGSPKPQGPKSGRYYRIDGEGGVTLLSGDDLYGISNTMAWLKDSRFVTADTADNTLFAYDVAAGGLLRNRRPFGATFERGFPDGSCIDAEGAVWTCRVAGGYALTRTLPDGTLDRVVELPCSWPTSCTFGGPDLKTLYVTSARFTHSEEHLAGNPQEGGLFAFEPGVAGVPEHRFRFTGR